MLYRPGRSRLREFKAQLLQAYLQEPLEGEAVFELFVRRIPPGRNVDAMPEGTVFFAGEPIVRMTAPLPQAQLVESRPLNLDPVHQCIIDEARRKGCDCIAMASHGRRGAAGILLASQTQLVLTHSALPVLVWRE